MVYRTLSNLARSGSQNGSARPRRGAVALIHHHRSSSSVFDRTATTDERDGDASLDVLPPIIRPRARLRRASRRSPPSRRERRGREEEEEGTEDHAHGVLRRRHRGRARGADRDGAVREDDAEDGGELPRARDGGERIRVQRVLVPSRHQRCARARVVVVVVVVVVFAARSTDRQIERTPIVVVMTSSDRRPRPPCSSSSSSSSSQTS